MDSQTSILAGEVTHLTLVILFQVVRVRRGAGIIDSFLTTNVITNVFRLLGGRATAKVGIIVSASVSAHCGIIGIRSSTLRPAGVEMVIKAS